MAQAALKLRNYQSRIVKSTLKTNTIVLLPTGSGKTLIAAEAIRRIGTPSVFFVPTIPLVEQQATAIGSHLSSFVIGQFNGECSLPKTFDVLSKRCLGLTLANILIAGRFVDSNR